MEINKIKLDGYEFNEITLLSCLIYSEDIDLETINKTLAYLPSKMFLDTRCRNIRDVIEEVKSLYPETIGTNHFIVRIARMANLIDEEFGDYTFDIREFWLPLTCLKGLIEKVQNDYFNQRYANAKSKKENEEIIKEEEEYRPKEEVDNVSDDAERMLELYEAQKDSAIFTSYRDINKAIGSLAGGDFIIFAGQPGGGKTAMMLNLALGMAKNKKKILIFSLEMPRLQLQQRIACCELCIDCRKFRSFSLTDVDKNKFYQYTQSEFKKLPISIFKKQTITFEHLRNIVMKTDADVIFIDYLGLIKTPANKKRYEAISDLSRDMKLLAMEANKPIVALHQLNREFQNRDDKVPKISDLRDSGQLEQDADMIWFVYRPALYDSSKGQEDMRFLVAKNRFGTPNQEIKLIFNGMYQQVLEPIETGGKK